MVLTSQMAFIERWESKYLKVTGIHQQSHVAKENTETNSFASPACISDFWPLHLQCFFVNKFYSSTSEISAEVIADRQTAVPLFKHNKN